MLAALHSAALGHMSKEQMGAAAGLYSMILRFAGAMIGTALAGCHSATLSGSGMAGH
ncbi:MAG: hypothetical protein R3E79_13130 [Caldilineaceae bacterium]